MKKHYFELICIIVLVLIGLLQPCKFSFECHKDKDVCVVNNRSIIGISIFKNIFRLSDIKDIKVNKYIKNEIRGARYNHHIEQVEYYDLNFIMANGRIIENVLKNNSEFDMIAIRKAEEITNFLNNSDIKDYETKEDYSLLEFIWFATAGVLALCIFFKHIREKK